jgi:hypothetical protein
MLFKLDIYIASMIICSCDHGSLMCLFAFVSFRVLSSSCPTTWISIPSDYVDNPTLSLFVGTIFSTYFDTECRLRDYLVEGIVFCKLPN